MAFEDQGSMDFKQHINLSVGAWNTIENDMLDFYGNRESHLSNFLNRVFLNFYPRASASITLALEKKREKYAKILKKTPNLEKQGGLRGDIIQKFIEQDEESLKRITGAYPKGEGRKFRLSTANMTYLTDEASDCGEDYYYQKIGRYLKAVFEEYAGLPYYKREQIFFSNEISMARIAIKSGKLLRITIPGNSTNPTKYDMKPYRVMKDRQSSYNYVTGYSQQSGNNVEAEPVPASFRISRIMEMKIMQNKSGRITKQQKRELDSLLIKKGAPFLVGEVKSIKVKLTEAGKTYYRQQLHLRPSYGEILDNNIYVFHCSERQIKNYFIKFGKDALVIEPVTLKEYFLNFFLDACHAYSMPAG
jgi:hypothetical protein